MYYPGAKKPDEATAGPSNESDAEILSYPVRGRLFLLDSHRLKGLGYPSRKDERVGTGREAPHLLWCGGFSMIPRRTEA